MHLRIHIERTMMSKNDEKTADITYSILWLDASANSSNDNRQAQNQLRSIINHLKTFDDEHQFQEYIQTVSSHIRLVLIVNGRLGRSVVPRIHDNSQIVSIYVYCMDKKRNEQWAQNYSKVYYFIFINNDFRFISGKSRYSSTR